MGFLFAFIALISWGVGDFLIQKETRRFGDWATLFFIDLFAFIGLLPFVWNDLSSLGQNLNGLFILVLASLTITAAALLDFEALKTGKIAIIEPINAFEIIVTTALSTFIANEILSRFQGIFLALIIVGIVLVATRSLTHIKNIKAEKGVFVALIAMVAMGTANFLFGIGTRSVGPLMINWFTSAFSVVFVSIYFFANSRWTEVASDWRRGKKIISAVGIIDNTAWLSFSAATLYLPIAVATGISESYIALAALLGIFFNREKLRIHQKLGLAVVLASVIILATIS